MIILNMIVVGLLSPIFIPMFILGFLFRLAKGGFELGYETCHLMLIKYYLGEL